MGVHINMFPLACEPSELVFGQTPLKCLKRSIWIIRILSKYCPNPRGSLGSSVNRDLCLVALMFQLVEALHNSWLMANSKFKNQSQQHPDTCAPQCPRAFRAYAWQCARKIGARRDVKFGRGLKVCSSQAGSCLVGPSESGGSKDVRAMPKWACLNFRRPSFSRESCLVGGIFPFQTHQMLQGGVKNSIIVSFHNAAAMLKKTLFDFNFFEFGMICVPVAWA